MEWIALIIIVVIIVYVRNSFDRIAGQLKQLDRRLDQLTKDIDLRSWKVAAKLNKLHMRRYAHTEVGKDEWPRAGYFDPDDAESCVEIWRGQAERMLREGNERGWVDDLFRLTFQDLAGKVTDEEFAQVRERLTEEERTRWLDTPVSENWPYGSTIRTPEKTILLDTTAVEEIVDTADAQSAVIVMQRRAIHKGKPWLLGFLPVRMELQGHVNAERRKQLLEFYSQVGDDIEGPKYLTDVIQTRKGVREALREAMMLDKADILVTEDPELVDAVRGSAPPSEVWSVQQLLESIREVKQPKVEPEARGGHDLGKGDPRSGRRARGRSRMGGF